ncbi:MAG: endonuclease [Planctomycetota bacterium]
MSLNRTTPLAIAVFSLVFCLAAADRAVANDPWAAPATYYDNATGTGSTLQSQLRTIMLNGQVLRSYGEFRDMAEVTDADLDNPGNILLVYDRSSVDGSWDSGFTWNREHVWPQSRQPGSASNGSFGNLGDPFALRPADPTINSNRGNRAFGFDSTTGSHGTVGNYYFPGDTDKGDIARSLFYSETVYGPSLGISLTDNFPTGNFMGDLSSLVAWNYADAPDEFERRRNHAIYAQNFTERDGTPTTNNHFTNNRNAFIDNPWLVHSVYVDQNNDTQVTLTGPDVIPGANGQTSVGADLGRVFQGQSASQFGSAAVTISKSGSDGTYFSVTSGGGATADLEGSYNAFALGAAPDQTLNVGFEDTLDTATPGFRFAQVVIDNLDVTTGAGPGFGAQDGDDAVFLIGSVVSQREVTQVGGPVDLGTSIVGTAVQANVDLATSGSDNERTRINTAANAANGVLTASAVGGVPLFDEASDTASYTLTTASANAGSTADNLAGSIGIPVTTAEEGGSGLAGEGSYADVQVDYTATFLDPSNASFDAVSDDDATSVDFGIVALGSGGGSVQQALALHNLENTAGYTADLDLDAVTLDTATGSSLAIDLAATPGIEAGSSLAFNVTLDTTTVGDFSAVFDLEVSDEDVAGATTTQLDDALTLEGLVTYGGDANLDFLVDTSDLAILAFNFGQAGLAWQTGDFNGDSVVDTSDLAILAFNFGQGTPAATAPVAAAAVPEPSTAIALAALSGAALATRPRRAQTLTKS